MQLQLFSGKMQNNKLTPILININVETGILFTSYRKMGVIHSALSSHPLIFIAQCTSCVILVQFDQINHELLCTFVFETTVSYGVIIPGNYSEIQSWVAIDVTRPEIKFHVDSISITMVSDVICKVESVFRPALWQPSTVKQCEPVCASSRYVIYINYV